ncbi:hypothetical protein [Paraburkholderia caribensis]|uniref:hypothetical protein n=1 Tax=Paraburkholderia caribensis TaxID=75105 RepID=UPI00078DED91|nr:hypothetical protein [Paraburkholderia caribensis]AMV44269.1 hypothetical protein ATN79_20205 [Paraburkholderia caribensis]
MTEPSKRSPLGEYFAALERLKEGRPQKAPIGTKISNDAVAIEAGRGKGSIKKSRALFADLIRAIDDAAQAERDPTKDQKAKLERTRNDAKDYRLRYEAALARELSLLRELYDLKKTLANLTGEKVVPLRNLPADKGS